MPRPSLRTPDHADDPHADHRQNSIAGLHNVFSETGGNGQIQNQLTTPANTGVLANMLSSQERALADARDSAWDRPERLV